MVICQKTTIHHSQWENIRGISFKNMPEMLKIIVSIQLSTIGPNHKKNTMKVNPYICLLVYMPKNVLSSTVCNILKLARTNNGKYKIQMLCNFTP